MNRSDFLKIVGATPFAIKGLLLSQDRQNVKKISTRGAGKSIQENCAIIRYDGKEIAVLRPLSININSDEHEIHYSDGTKEYIEIRRNLSVEFDEVEAIDIPYLFSLAEDGQRLHCDAYRSNDGMFLSFDGYFTFIERHYEFSNIRLSGVFSSVAK